jgi:peptidyl-dipeptidase Dcp
MTNATSASSKNHVTNPLLANWADQPYGLPPFGVIAPKHFLPAFEAALAAHAHEIDAIANNTAAPDFANTVVAVDASGRLLRRVEQLFNNLTYSETSAALQEIERTMAPRLAAHESFIYMHAGLFARIDALHAQRAALNLHEEQSRLLDRIHLDFVRAGAKLHGVEKTRYADIMQRLAALTTQFSQNVLADEASWHLDLDSEIDLAGLPPFVLAAARSAAQERCKKGGKKATHTITLSRSLIVPFLMFSTRRDLREIAFKAWTQRGENTGPTDNRPIAREIMQLRLEQAKLHGYACYADYALTDTMAGKQPAVRDLLTKLWQPAKARAADELAALKALALSRGESSDIAPWDWRFYAEKVRQARYDLDDAQVKPYFSLDRMMQAMFDCAQRLFGLAFIEQPQIRGYHPDVRVFEVRKADGSVKGVFLSDNFARPSKRGGAWMSEFRSQSRIGGDVLPIVVNNNNFAKAPAGEPTLLSADDVRTLFHEFGHGLHGLLSDVTYERIAGTSVLRDFVELPSQIFEHWATEPQVLKRHARHVQTGEPIPDALIEKIEAAGQFNQGFESVEYGASALVDLALHAQTDFSNLDIGAFEKAELQRIGMPEQIVMRHRLPHFGHLFSSSYYASGYYVYLWAEVLDADGYDAFVEAGDPFDAEVARRLKTFIYSSGNSREPGAAFRAFRGREPVVEPMLRQRGLIGEVAV